jgi:hypothetical protein
VPGTKFMMLYCCRAIVFLCVVSTPWAVALLAWAGGSLSWAGEPPAWAGEQPASAGERPAWVQSGSKAQDGNYRYYVGRGTAKTDAEAFGEARRDAQVQAVRENYGTTAQIELRALEDSRTTRTLKSVDEVFPKVSFLGFEQVENYQEKQSQQVEVWSLFRYSKVTIQKEKLRLARDPGSEVPIEISESGNAAWVRTKGALEVFSSPGAAEVFIDNKRYGVTPLRLLGVLDPGVHSLKLDHPEFAVHSEPFQLQAGRKLTLQKNLRKALGHLSISTSPSGARVSIEGHPAGLSPVKLFPVSAGKPVLVEISSDTASPLRTEVTVPRERHESRHYNLEKHTARADLRANEGPSPASEAPADSGLPQISSESNRVPNENLDSKAPFSFERSIYNFSLIPAGYSSSPTATIEIPHAYFGAAFSIDVTSHWFVEFGYRFANREVEYANALITGKFHEFEFSSGYQLPLGKYGVGAVEAVLSRLIGNYQLRVPGELEFRTAPALGQWGIGSAIRYRWLLSAQSWGLLTTGWGLGLRAAGLYYFDSNVNTLGKWAFQGELQWFFQF